MKRTFKMDILDDSENNAKISDSGYSNSCNSLSRLSRSSKYTNSGSQSSGSSGYGGKKSHYGGGNSSQQIDKRMKDKEIKKKKQAQIEKILEAQVVIEQRAPEPEREAPVVTASADTDNAIYSQSPKPSNSGKGIVNMEICSSTRSSFSDEDRSCSTLITVPDIPGQCFAEGFSCIISMHDGVVMQTAMSLTKTLGFPKNMWIGRSFIDFVHPNDRQTFASHITTDFAAPKNENGIVKAVQAPQDNLCSMVCRIREYRSLSTGFGVKERSLVFTPFLLKLSFKDRNEEEEKEKVYLVVLATPFLSAFKIPNEPMSNAIPFVIRHSANGKLLYIDTESVPYLGYVPQELADKDTMQLYHPEDLLYLRRVYETIAKEGSVPRARSFRLLTQNGDSVRVETEWSSFINPWSKKLECIVGKHFVIEGPSNPKVFEPPEVDTKPIRRAQEEENKKIQALRENILHVVNEVLTKPAVMAKQQMSKRCQEVSMYMDTLLGNPPEPIEELKVEVQEVEQNSCERDSVMLGGLSPHHDQDSRSSTETLLSYNQLNYQDNLQRYFDRNQPNSYEDLHKIKTNAADNVVDLVSDQSVSWSLASVALNSGDSDNMSTGDIDPNGVATVRLTESLLNKHNVEMEKVLMKLRREKRTGGKLERGKAADLCRQQKKEHLARCNAAYQPTSPADYFLPMNGIKRNGAPFHSEAGPTKHHCPSPRVLPRVTPRSLSRTTPQMLPRMPPCRQLQTTAIQPMSAVTNTIFTQSLSNSMNGMNTYVFGVGSPQQMPIMTPYVSMPGMFPVYYSAPNGMMMQPRFGMNNMMPGNHSGQYQIQNVNQHPMPHSSHQFPPPHSHSQANHHHQHQQILPLQFQVPSMPYMMYGQGMQGQQFMYTPMNAITPCPNHHHRGPRTTDVNPLNVPLGLDNRHYEEVCKPSIPYKSKSNVQKMWKERRLIQHSLRYNQESGDSFSSSALNQTSDTAADMTSRSEKRSSDEMADRTDGESSYSSFYSSFVRTEAGSGSAEESDSAKKATDSDKNNDTDTSRNYYETPVINGNAKRGIEPWMEQLTMTSEVVYKYQVKTKSMQEVLEADRLALASMEQPEVVDNQLGQLYVDLEMQGMAAQLTLEEGMFSSSDDSCDETTTTIKVHSKLEYSQLVMIFEENTPFPPPEEQIGDSNSQS